MRKNCHSPYGISYAITTHNEPDLKNLINLLTTHLTEDDEIVIVDDFSNDPRTLDALSDLENVYKRRLDTSYADQKNYLNSKCTKNYIFQLDADELPTKTLLKVLKKILKENSESELMWLPRANIVHGITDDHLAKWMWRRDTQNRINYPDWQGRVYKNKKEINWWRDVHERVTGYSTEYKFPINSELELIHEKTISKQIESNNLYFKNYNRDGSAKQH